MVVQEFLSSNKLRLIIRSHEGPDARERRDDLDKMTDGYTVDHMTASKAPIRQSSVPLPARTATYHGSATAFQEMGCHSSSRGELAGMCGSIKTDAAAVSVQSDAILRMHCLAPCLVCVAGVQVACL